MKHEQASEIHSVQRSRIMRGTALLLAAAASLGVGKMAFTGDSEAASAPVPIATELGASEAPAVATEIQGAAVATAQAVRAAESGEVTPPSVDGIPSTLSEKFAEDTLYIVFGGRGTCTGKLISDVNNQPVGFKSSPHCGVSEQLLERHHDNGDYVVLPDKITAYVGRQYGGMEYVGTATQIIVPISKDSTARDNMVGVFEGSNPETVYANLNLASYDPSQKALLNVGEQAYSSGWPEKHNQGYTPKRQEWAITFVGTSDVIIGSVPETISDQQTAHKTQEYLNVPVATPAGVTGKIALYIKDMHIFGMRYNKNQAGCTKGSSGMVGTLSNSTEIGPLSGSVGFTPDGSSITPEVGEMNRASYEAVLGVELDDFDMICLFDRTEPNLSNMEVYDVRQP